MSIEADLADFVLDDATVAGLIGDRMYPDAIPSGADYPAVSFQRVSTPRLRSLSGLSGLDSPRFQINCWAKGNGAYASARAIADAIKDRLADYRGVMGNSTVQDVILDNEEDILDEKLGIDADVPYGIRMDFVIWHQS